MRYFPGEVVETKYWDSKKQRAKVSQVQFGDTFNEAYRNLNERLNILESHVAEIWSEHLEENDKKKLNKGNVRNCLISPKDFQEELEFRTENKERPQPAPAPTLAEFIDIYVSERENAADSKRGTWKVLKTWGEHLKEYAKDRGKALDYEMVDWHFFADFPKWLNEPTRRHSLNYAAKGFAVIQQFLREAKRREYHNLTAFEKMKLKSEKVPKFALTFEELDAIYHLDLSDIPRLERVRDLFIVGAYTGLRISDFKRIRPEYIIEEDGEKFLSIVTQKTGTPVEIPLFPQVEAVVKKYEFTPPRISSQKFNDYIKEIAKMAGIDSLIVDVRTVGGKRIETTYPKWEKVASHVCRRSFATNFYLLGLPAAMLMKITGHSTERQFMNYIAIDGRENAKKMSKEAKMRMQEQKLRVV